VSERREEREMEERRERKERIGEERLRGGREESEE